MDLAGRGGPSCVNGIVKRALTGGANVGVAEEWGEVDGICSGVELAAAGDVAAGLYSFWRSKELDTLDPLDTPPGDEERRRGLVSSCAGRSSVSPNAFKSDTLGIRGRIQRNLRGDGNGGSDASRRSKPVVGEEELLEGAWTEGVGVGILLVLSMPSRRSLEECDDEGRPCDENDDDDSFRGTVADWIKTGDELGTFSTLGTGGTARVGGTGVTATGSLVVTADGIFEGPVDDSDAVSSKEIDVSGSFEGHTRSFLGTCTGGDAPSSALS